MVTATGAVALVVLVGIPGFPGLSLPKFGKRKAPVDSVATTWTNPSRLALRNEFVLGAVEPTLDQADATGRIRMNVEPRQVRVRIDPDSGEVIVVREHGEVPLGFASRQSLSDYSRDVVQATFDKQWRDRSRQSINSLGQFTPQTGGTDTPGLQFTMPGLLPKQVQSLLGPGSPAINVSGSENIRISGQSNWTNQQTGPLGQKKSLFPSLDMQQDLEHPARGPALGPGEAQSAPELSEPDPAREPHRDQLQGRRGRSGPGARSGQHQPDACPEPSTCRTAGATKGCSASRPPPARAPSTSRFWPASRRAAASVPRTRAAPRARPGGCTTTSTSAASTSSSTTRTWKQPSTSSCRRSRSTATTAIRTRSTHRSRARRSSIRARPTLPWSRTFRLLNPGPDQDYEILSNIYGPAYPVLRMRQPLSYDQKLAITYEAGHFDPNNNPIGDYQPIGGGIVPGTDDIAMKLIRAPLSDLRRTPQGDFIDSLGFTRVRHIELKNFYQLPGMRIDERSLVLSIERGDEVPPITFVPGPGGVSVPYLEVLGLDNQDETTGNPVDGHDGRIDGTIVASNTRVFVDFVTGTLFFADPRPFAPRLNQPFERFIDSQLNRRARLDGSGADLNAPNPVIYDTLQPRAPGCAVPDRGRVHRAERGRRDPARARQHPRGLGGGHGQRPDLDPRSSTTRSTTTSGASRSSASSPRSDQLNIDYSYAPLFQQAGRTLIGSSFRAEGRERQPGRRVPLREPRRPGPAAAPRRGAVAQYHRRPERRSHVPSRLDDAHGRQAAGRAHHGAFRVSTSRPRSARRSRIPTPRTRSTSTTWRGCATRCR